MTTFFLDENISRHLARFLQELQGNNEHLFDSFSPGTPDEIWIPEAGRLGWVVITANHAIMSTEHLRRALLDAKVIAFFLYKRFVQSNCYEQSWRLVKAWPGVVEAASGTRPGTCFDINENGSIKRR